MIAEKICVTGVQTWLLKHSVVRSQSTFQATPSNVNTHVQSGMATPQEIIVCSSLLVIIIIGSAAWGPCSVSGYRHKRFYFIQPAWHTTRPLPFLGTSYSCADNGTSWGCSDPPHICDADWHTHVFLLQHVKNIGLRIILCRLLLLGDHSPPGRLVVMLTISSTQSGKCDFPSAVRTFGAFSIRRGQWACSHPLCCSSMVTA